MLLQDALASSVSSNFSDYVMKVSLFKRCWLLGRKSKYPIKKITNAVLFSPPQCLWRINRFLPERIGHVNLDRILLDIHNFKKMMSKERLQRLPNDMAQRTLKTLLHTLCRLTGPKVSNAQNVYFQPARQFTFTSKVNYTTGPGVTGL